MYVSSHGAFKQVFSSWTDGERPLVEAADSLFLDLKTKPEIVSAIRHSSYPEAKLHTL